MYMECQELTKACSMHKHNIMKKTYGENPTDNNIIQGTHLAKKGTIRPC